MSKRFSARRPTGSVIYVGAPWGDEGKGKVVDAEAEGADAIYRYNGGGNAGHTLKINGRKIVTHILPVGIVHPGMECVVGPYVVCDPETICKELEISKEFGSQVFLDRHAPLVLPIHGQIDKLREGASGAGKIGTTGRGIGPCYEDWTSRRGVCLGDLMDEATLRASLLKGGYYAERSAVARHYGGEPQSLNEVVEWCLSFQKRLAPHLDDTLARLARHLNDPQKKIVFEGAQGIMLDVGLGRPFATSSFCTPAAAMASMGVSHFDHTLMVAKAYTTRVGNGPFPTEAMDGNSWLESLRTDGEEFGATTGRARRCGFLDLPLLRFCARVAGITGVVITKLDILSRYERIPVCMDYELEGRTFSAFDTLTPDLLEMAKPRYEEFRGWNEDISACRTAEDLPTAAREYLDRIAAYLKIPVVGVSVGAERDAIIAL